MKRFTSHLLSLIVAGLTFVSTSAEAESLKERLSKRTRPEMQVLGAQKRDALNFQLEKAGFKTKKSCAPMRAAQPIANLQANSWGFLEGPEGTWTYTQTFETANFYYTKSVITLYDCTHKQRGQITIDIPDGRKVNMLEPTGVITSKLFDNDAKTIEVTIHMHEIGSERNEYGQYEQINKMLTYRMDGTLVNETIGFGMFVDMKLNEWTQYQRMLVLHDDDFVDTIRVDVLASTWGGDVKVEHTFEIPKEETIYSDGGYISVTQIDGQPYYIISHYEKPWASGYDLTTWDPIPTENNHYIMKVYNKNYKLVDSISVPIEKPEDALYRFAAFGLMSANDISKNYYSNTNTFDFVVSYYDYIIASDDSRYEFVVFNNKGEKIKDICKDVTATYFELSPVEGQEDQMAFMQQIGDAQQISMVDLPSCNVAAVIPAVLHGEKISTTLDRYPKGDSYQYVISMGSATSDAEGNVLARIGWYNKNLSFDHFTTFNLGQYGQMFSPLITSDGLNPYLFDTDDEHEFAYIGKIGNAVNNKLANILYIANEDGSIIEQFQGNEQIGDLFNVTPININTVNAELAIYYLNNASKLYDLNYYKLPFKKFQGGTGTAEDPYLIATAGDLMQISKNPSAHYKLVADISMAHMPSAWTPIDNFSGKLEGNGHSISGLVINSNNVNVGLFGNVENGSISNIVFVNPTIKINDNNSYAGILSGIAMADTLQNIHIYGANIIDAAGKANVTIGGLVGQATNYSQIYSCSFNGTINTPGSKNIGGIAGDTRTSAYVFSCVATGALTGASYVGGIVGSTGTDGLIFDCHSDVELTANNCIGGIVGSNGSRALITRNYAKGTIKALKSDSRGFSVGGIAGRIESDWSRAEGIVISNNVTEADIITIGATSKPKSANRIIGFTIADEDYLPGEQRFKEIGLSNNYATSTVKITGTTITSTDAASVNGADKEKADYNKDFFTSLGFAYGTIAAEPWKGEKGLPVLYFENIAKALQFNTASAMVVENESSNVIISVYGTDASEINITTSDATIAEVEIIGEEENSITVKISGKKIGNAVITATAGDITATCAVAVVDKATGIEGIETGSTSVEAIYNINGMRLNSLQKGLNIIKMSNGSTKKVMIK